MSKFTKFAIMLSLSEENYLKSIYHLSNHGVDEVSTNAIADSLKTKPASVSDMLKKLSQKELIDYEKYQGVKLSVQGKIRALHVIRKHRLWEVFLVQKLGFHWDEVHEVAEQLEHINSELLTKKLDDFLGHPAFDPHGDPIPDENGKMKIAGQRYLNSFAKATEGTVVGIKDSSAAFLQYLDKLGIGLGTKVLVKDIIEFDGSMEIMINGEKTLTVSKDTSKNILVN
jgi:DtxR family Mn-dependent transcriptional regulator